SLRVALGDPQTEVILIDAWREPVSLPQLDELIETALQNRSDVVSQEAIVRAARLGVKLAQLQRRPRFNVVGTAEYGRHNSSSGPAWSIYGGIEQTLFDGGATKAALRQAQAECVAAEAQLESLKRNVALEVESSWLRLRQSAEAIAAAEAASAEAHAALRAAETRYAANVGILLEITDAQLRADEADVNVVSAYYDYNIALADLERAIGLRTIQEQP
ncbi:MAG: TolC family protein, partial [Candidatus Zipacnadales bacterium]